MLELKLKLKLIMASVRSEAMVDGVAEVGAATCIEDVPADVLSLVLRRLDGASLAAAGCTCTGFRELAADAAMWRAICLAAWPSVRDVPGVCGGGGRGGGCRALFADAFPFPAASSSSVAGSESSGSTLPARLVSAVDLHHNGVCVMSRVVETDTSSEWFLASPFRLDALVQEGFSAPAPITPAELTLSWILIDPATGRAVNASSRRPVSVDRSWLTGETVARFTVVLGDGGGVALDAAVTCDDRYGHVREVSLCSVDSEGVSISGRDGLATVAAAMGGARQSRGAEAAARRRYEAFARGTAARKARRDGVVDLCCSGVAAAAFVGLLSTLTLQ
ncbi:probable F-box protein At2g36090 [Oryza brachyantha]|uniref:probable F-box protein At2g36090 n=1 Tax=Oryza brachyantha TaxID=4533 RepID=UPI001ADB9696|nr:probable F-box protein At2g36090 [Oryza brachyantha]